jgi:hypothetical protein
MPTKSNLARWIPALLIVCICTFAAAWGWQVTRFAQARTAVLDNLGSGASLNSWKGFLGLGGEALQLSGLRLSAMVLPRKLHAAQLVELITRHPLSAQAWLSLAEDRLVLAMSPRGVGTAVTMSWIVGPNEGSVMWRRGLFEMMRWEALSGEARRKAVLDIVGAMNGGVVNDVGILSARALLAQQEPEARSEIASFLGASGLSQKQLGRLGLQAAHY